MLVYLYKKLQLEEKQRLATEEQAQVMISTLEKSLAQMVRLLLNMRANKLINF